MSGKRSFRPRVATSAAGRPADRASDWSEATPEWGLAGNAAIVIGPRLLTRGLDLRGRVFLHSYDSDQEPQGVVLEQLLTAPLMVAQWINAQYYFSAVAPATFGAGDKTTHNASGDLGVLTGAHGDIRTGLPWQALFRSAPGANVVADDLVHEPVRLLALIDAAPHLITSFVLELSGLRHLIANQWISQVSVSETEALRLETDLVWRSWQGYSEIAVA